MPQFIKVVLAGNNKEELIINADYITVVEGNTVYLSSLAADTFKRVYLKFQGELTIHKLF